MVLSGLYLNTIVVEEGCSTTKHLFDDVHPRSSTTLLGPIKENVPMILYFSRSFFLEEWIRRSRTRRDPILFQSHGRKLGYPDFCCWLNWFQSLALLDQWTPPQLFNLYVWWLKFAYIYTYIIEFMLLHPCKSHIYIYTCHTLWSCFNQIMFHGFIHYFTIDSPEIHSGWKLRRSAGEAVGTLPGPVA